MPATIGLLLVMEIIIELAVPVVADRPCIPRTYEPPLLCRLAIAPTLKVCAVPLMVAVMVPVTLVGEVELFFA